MAARENIIRTKIEQAFSPVFLELENESYKHSVPAGSESHFRLVLVSARFSGKSRVERSRMVHEALALELKSGLHALALRLLAPDEWNSSSSEFQSPDCASASAHRKSAK